MICYSDVDIEDFGEFRTNGNIETLEGGSVTVTGTLFANGVIQANSQINVNNALVISNASTVTGLTIAKIQGLQSALYF